MYHIENMDHIDTAYMGITPTMNCFQYVHKMRCITDAVFNSNPRASNLLSVKNTLPGTDTIDAKELDRNALRTSMTIIAPQD